MKKTLLILCLLAFIGNMAVAQYRPTPSNVDTTLLQQKNIFLQDGFNKNADKPQTAGWHLRNAGADITGSVAVGIVGSLLTGVLAYGSGSQPRDSQTFGMAALAMGGMTLIASVTLVVAAGSHLKKAGEIMDGQLSD